MPNAGLATIAKRNDQILEVLADIQRDQFIFREQRASFAASVRAITSRSPANRPEFLNDLGAAELYPFTRLETRFATLEDKLDVLIKHAILDQSAPDTL